mgnify:CR=1 FL=1
MRSTVTISFPMPPKSRRSPATSSPRADSAVAIRDERISLTELHDLQQKASRLERIAKALLNKRIGERVRLRTPGGEKELEILTVAWE